MNEGRRQLLPPPRQLLQPGAAARVARAIARQSVRDMGAVLQRAADSGRGVRLEGKGVTRGVETDAVKP